MRSRCSSSYTQTNTRISLIYETNAVVLFIRNYNNCQLSRIEIIRTCVCVCVTSFVAISFSRQLTN